MYWFLEARTEQRKDGQGSNYKNPPLLKKINDFIIEE